MKRMEKRGAGAGWGVQHHSPVGLSREDLDWLRTREREGKRADIVASVLVGLALALLAAAFI